jgi:hypothetical protein
MLPAPLTLAEDGDGHRVFDAKIDLDDLDLADSARPYVEAYYKSSYMRFDLGTVAGRQSLTENERRLTEVDAGDIVYFRVKVVDETFSFGRVLADADKIAPVAPETTAVRRIPLLPVQPYDLGELAWRVDFDTGQPELWVNNRISPRIMDIVRQDTVWLSLVFPAAIREILSRIFFVEERDDPWSDDDSYALWLRWGSDLVGSSPPQSDDDEDGRDTEKREWVNQVAKALCVQVRQACSAGASPAGKGARFP